MRRSSVARSLRADRGASAVEYGLMLAAITGVIVLVIFAFGNFVHQSFEDSTTCLAYTGVGEPDC
jgi:pilus assembly protein Flp/PilA